MRVSEHLRLLALIGEVQGPIGLEEFRVSLLAALRRAVPCDWISLNDVGPEPSSVVALVEPSFPPEAHELFARHASENPLLRRYQRTGDGRAYRFSDVVTPAELHATALHREFYAPIGLEHQIALVLSHSHSSDRLLALALSRRSRDFTDAERALLDAARPFLIDAYRTAITIRDYEQRLAEDPRLPTTDALTARWAGLGVTPREAEMVREVARGRSNHAIADARGLSPRTVDKHLERAFRKLGVPTRAEAAELVWT